MMNHLVLALILMVAGFAGSAARAADGDAPGFFRSWLAERDKAGDLRIDFTFTKSLPALKEPITSSGRFWSYADGRFLWEMGMPPTSVLRYDGVTLESWEAVENKWHKLDPTDRRMRVWMNFLGARKLTVEELTRDFLITTPEARKPMARMILEPRSKQEKKRLKQLELEFDTSKNQLMRLRVEQGDGGSQAMNFKAPRPMGAADKKVVPPPAPK